MNKFALLLLLNCIFCTNRLTAQRAVVCDAADRLPIPFAIAFDLQQNKAVYTDSGGVFLLPANGGSVRISSPGYETAVFNQPRGQDTFFLKPVAASLGEVVVSSKAPKSRLAECPCDWTGNAYQYSRIGLEMAVRIELPDSNAHRIKGVHIGTRQSENGLPLRLQLYLPDSDGKPGVALLQKAAIISPKDSRRRQTFISLRDQSVSVRNKALFVSVEWVGTPTEPGIGWGVQFCKNVDASPSFVRHVLEGKAEWDKPEPDFELRGRPATTGLRARIEYY